jgi:hypothetical protein
MPLEYDSERQTLWRTPCNIAVRMAFNHLCGESDRNQNLSILKQQ